MTTQVQRSTKLCKSAWRVGISIVFTAGFCFSQAGISLSPTSGPPTTKLFVSGSGFTANVKIDIYFSSRREAVATANKSGSFSNISILAPAWETPGTYRVKAVARQGGTSASAKFLVRTNWSQFHFDNMQRWNRYENVLNVNSVGNLQEKWSYATGGTDEWSAPAVVNGILYIGSFDGNVYALNTSNGTKLWSKAIGSYVNSSPAVANGVVYIGSADSTGTYGNNLYALDASTGATLWSYAMGEVDSSPAVANGVVYVGSDDGTLYALDASTGGLLWRYSTGGDVDGSPAVVNGVVYVGSNDGNVYALNASTGVLLWSYTVGGHGATSPAVANGVVYVGSNDGGLYALDAGTGALLWKYDKAGGFSPAVAYGMVYAGSGYGNVYALDARAGTLRWSCYVGGEHGEWEVFSSPAVANGVVYVAGINYLYALNAQTGAILWDEYIGHYSAEYSPAVADGVIYIGSYYDSYSGKVYAFGLK